MSDLGFPVKKWHWIFQIDIYWFQSGNEWFSTAMVLDHLQMEGDKLLARFLLIYLLWLHFCTEENHFEKENCWVDLSYFLSHTHTDFQHHYISSSQPSTMESGGHIFSSTEVMLWQHAFLKWHSFILFRHHVPIDPGGLKRGNWG